MESQVTTGQQDAAPQPAVDTLAAKGNFGLAVAAGLGAAIAGAVLWAIVTVVSEMELGIVAVAIGFAVGQAIRAAGKSSDKKFGYLGAACGLLGCALGNVLSALAFYAQANHADYGTVLAGIDPDFLVRLVSLYFSPMDLLFYAIAIYEAYRFSLAPIRR